MDALLLILLSSLGLMALVLVVTFVLYIREHVRYMRLERRSRALMIEGRMKELESAV